MPSPAAFARLALACSLGAAGAPASAQDIDLTLYRNGETYLKPTLEFQTAYFVQTGAWGGASDEILGAPVDDWAEWSLEPGLEGAFDLGTRGLVYAGLSGVATWTRVGLDAAGSNFDDRRPEAFLLEDAYLGWRSGELFPGLGKDAIDLSLGAQDYHVGNGFLFWEGASDGGDRGAYWISPRSAFAMTAIARLKTGPFSGEAVWLTPNDQPDSHTRIVGVNGDYAIGEIASVGLGYWYFYDSDILRRDGLHVIDLRGSLAPLRRFPDLVLSSEITHERNGRLNDSWGGYVEAAYTFKPCAWEPHLSYRYSLFTGDDQSQDQIEAFDPIFYGLEDWGTWYQGELLGEYAVSNRNLAVHTLRARVQPSEAITLNLLYFHYRLEDLASELLSRLAPRAGSIEHKNLGDEIDLAADWNINDYLALSLVLAVFEPGKGAKDFFEDDQTWFGFMLAAKLQF